MSWPVAVQAFDEAVLRAAWGSPAPTIPLFYVATVIGGGWALLGLVPLLFRPTSRPFALWLLGTIVITSGAVSLLKLLFGRARPCDALGWCSALSIASPGGHSFPSGHAAGSFAFAAFVALRAPRWSVPALVYALIVAWSRCVLGVHYPTDVAAGALLGSAIGFTFARVSQRSARAAALTSAKA